MGAGGGPLKIPGGTGVVGSSHAEICNKGYESYTRNMSRQYRHDVNGESIWIEIYESLL